MQIKELGKLLSNLGVHIDRIARFIETQSEDNKEETGDANKVAVSNTGQGIHNLEPQQRSGTEGLDLHSHSRLLKEEINCFFQAMGYEVYQNLLKERGSIEATETVYRLYSRIRTLQKEFVSVETYLKKRTEIAEEPTPAYTGTDSVLENKEKSVVEMPERPMLRDTERLLAEVDARYATDENDASLAEAEERPAQKIMEDLEELDEEDEVVTKEEVGEDEEKETPADDEEKPVLKAVDGSTALEKEEIAAEASRKEDKAEVDEKKETLDDEDKESMKTAVKKTETREKELPQYNLERNITNKSEEGSIAKTEEEPDEESKESAA